MAASRRTTIVTKEEEGRIRGAAFRTTAGLSPCRRQMPRSSLGPAASWHSLQPREGFDMKRLREQIEQMHFRDFVADV